MFALGSSRTKIFLFSSNALARQRSCCYPFENNEQESISKLLNPSLKFLTVSSNSTWRNTSQIVPSYAVSRGSKFSLRFPWKKKGV